MKYGSKFHCVLAINGSNNCRGAFGLLHDYQRPDLWTAEYGGTAMTPSFFFNYQYLKKFASLEANRGTKSAGEACQLYRKAAEFEFSATGFLAEPPNGSIVPSGALDLKSLMTRTCPELVESILGLPLQQGSSYTLCGTAPRFY
jgi:hypothetical protein